MDATSQEPIDGEEWRPAPGFEGHYSVSSLGRIRDEPRRRHYRLGSTTSQDGGYRRAPLSVDGLSRMVSLHVLVAVAFIGPRDPLLVIDHIDDNPANARLDNLQYVTRSQNNRKAAARRRAKKIAA